MSQKLRSYVRQNHLALLALGIAVAGVPTAWAVARNTIGATQIKTNAVGKSEIKQGAVGPSEAKNLLASDFKPGQIPAGPQGEQGVPGTARAYGTIRPQDCVPGDKFPPYHTCTPVRAKGIAEVIRVFPGQYCVTVLGIDSREVSAVVSVDHDSTAVPQGNASVMASPSEGIGAFCPVAGAFHVRTQRQLSIAVNKGAGTENQDVSNLSSSVEDVGFSIIVP